MDYYLIKAAVNSSGSAEKYIRDVWNDWKPYHFTHLPAWLQDNDYLRTGHRPPLQSFRACFWSIFRLHTETANIWTHLFGCFLFTCLAIYVLILAPHPLNFEDKLVFGVFFATAILCLGLSSCYHTVSCHSPDVGRLFSKLDYCGIALLITGSFVPWLYYGFYCDYLPKVCYLILVSTLGLLTIVVSLTEKFSEPNYRHLRAGVFTTFGLSGLIPGIHWAVSQDWQFFYEARESFICLGLMAFLYMAGAFLYAMRIPERFFPGKCDYWFHSHQLFHVLVLAAAFVHYRGITEMAMFRLTSENNVCHAPAFNQNDHQSHHHHPQVSSHLLPLKEL